MCMCTTFRWSKIGVLLPFAKCVRLPAWITCFSLVWLGASHAGGGCMLNVRSFQVLWVVCFTHTGTHTCTCILIATNLMTLVRPPRRESESWYSSIWQSCVSANDDGGWRANWAAAPGYHVACIGYCNVFSIKNTYTHFIQKNWGQKIGYTQSGSLTGLAYFTRFTQSIFFFYIKF